MGASARQVRLCDPWNFMCLTSKGLVKGICQTTTRVEMVVIPVNHVSPVGAESVCAAVLKAAGVLQGKHQELH